MKETKTVDQFLMVADEEKPKWACTTKDAGQFRIGVQDGGTIYCESCGSMPEKGIGRASSDTKYCVACFRSLHRESIFTKES